MVGDHLWLGSWQVKRELLLQLYSKTILNVYVSLVSFQNNNIGQAGGLELARSLVVCELLEEIR